LFFYVYLCEIIGKLKIIIRDVFKILVINEAVYLLYINFKKIYDSVKREILYIILFEYVIHIKLVSYPHETRYAYKNYRTETYSRVRVGKNLSDMFPIKIFRKKCIIDIVFKLCLILSL